MWLAPMAQGQNLGSQPRRRNRRFGSGKIEKLRFTELRAGLVRSVTKDLIRAWRVYAANRSALRLGASASPEVERE